jgi:hypothetical protein
MTGVFRRYWSHYRIIGAGQVLPITWRATITVNDGAQAHAATSPTLTSNTVTVNNGAQAHSATSPTIAAKSTITPNNGAQAHSATSPTLAANSVIVPANAAQAHTATSPAILTHIAALTPLSRSIALTGSLAARTMEV